MFWEYIGVILAGLAIILYIINRIYELIEFIKEYRYRSALESDSEDEDEEEEIDEQYGKIKRW